MYILKGDYMRLKNFRRLIDDCHIKIVNKYGHEVLYIDDLNDSNKLDDCIVIGVRAIDYRVLEVKCIRENHQLEQKVRERLKR